MSPASTTIVWVRNDLRVADNPALHDACADPAARVIVLYVRETQPEPEGPRPPGAAARWWLHQSLERFSQRLQGAGVQLVLRSGDPREVLPQLVAESGAQRVVWNRRYTAARATDAQLKAQLRERGISVQSFQANLLVEPWAVSTAQGTPFRVFTPFWRACLALGEPRLPLPVPERLQLSGEADETAAGFGRPAGAAAGTLAGAATGAADVAVLASERLTDWDLLPTSPDWAAGLRQTWQPGEDGAAKRLSWFVREGLAQYHRRDEPDAPATSFLSPFLRWGELSPFQVWHAVRAASSGAGRADDAQLQKNVARFLSEIGWREFHANVAFFLPNLRQEPVRPEFASFPWREPFPGQLRAWQRGQTGVPLVDAGMRELWHTGVMHNRVRMVVASFLVKNLLVDWRIGEAWFWDTLVDADEASNPGNWQWVAGCGVDAAPYFRVFNPVLQQKKFDPNDAYVSRWVPEYLTWEYPRPIVDLLASRADALAAFENMRASQP